jgi:hypothetical protein
MKKIFLAFALCASSVIMNKSTAQPVLTNATVHNATTPGLNNGTGIKENSAASTVVNPRAVKDFQRTFHDVKDETWSNSADRGYEARFISDSVKTVVIYNHRGVWQYTLRYYNEKKLLHDVRSTVKSTYYDYDISGVIQVLIEDKEAYLIYLRNDSYIKEVLVTDDDMKELQSFKNNN